MPYLDDLFLWAAMMYEEGGKPTLAATLAAEYGTVPASAPTDFAADFPYSEPSEGGLAYQPPLLVGRPEQIGGPPVVVPPSFTGYVQLVLTPQAIQDFDLGSEPLEQTLPVQISAPYRGLPGISKPGAPAPPPPPYWLAIGTNTVGPCIYGSLPSGAPGFFQGEAGVPKGTLVGFPFNFLNNATTLTPLLWLPCVRVTLQLRSG
jgi:hypothetical protein